MADVVISGVSKRFGANLLAVDDISLNIPDGCVLTLLGQSGCGKTTTLRMVAGLERPSSGQIRIGGRVVADAAQNIFVPPEKRGIGMVFQNYAVWPHLTVLENVMYPLKMRKVPRQDRKPRALAALEQVGIADKAGVSPGVLSGGQQQRVAIARALVFSPQVLLMDEPFSNLDARLRDRMGEELRELHAELGVTTVYVTHDQNEAMLLSDQVVVMESGRVLQHDTPREVALHPRNSRVAGFLGYNADLKGRVTSAHPGGTGGSLRLDVSADSWTAGAFGPVGTKEGDDVALVVRPGVLKACDCAAHDNDTHQWQGIVEKVRPIGDRERVVVAFAGTSLTLERPVDLIPVAAGDPIALCGPARSLWAISAEEEAA